MARGFAAMTVEKRKELAAAGGRAVHAKGVAHEWSIEEARLAGRKGGQTPKKKPAPAEPLPTEAG